MNYAEFRTKQDGVYSNMVQAHLELGTEGHGLASNVTQNMGAYLVAWRHSDSVTARLAQTSFAVANTTEAIVYWPENIHTTVSDHALTPGLVIDPSANPEQAEVLDGLSDIVKAGIALAPRHSRSDRAVSFLDGAVCNGKSVVAPGQPNDAFLDVYDCVVKASHLKGFNEGKGLKGAWGAHATVNQIRADAEPADALVLRKTLDDIRERNPIGRSIPTAIDVGYLALTADGFSFTTHERFPLDRQ